MSLFRSLLSVALACVLVNSYGQSTINWYDETQSFLPIPDGGTVTATIPVDIPWISDISQCPLTKVCLTIEHNRIGDLHLSLTSPSGQNYLLMADEVNGIGGCNIDGKHAEICITTGTDHPLTNNTEYDCNGGDCSLGNCCFTGNWTVPCGGVTSEIGIQAPNCDLADFNQPGMAVNGDWVLTIKDNCSTYNGKLRKFSLVFECGNGCEAQADNTGFNLELGICVLNEPYITSAKYWFSDELPELDTSRFGIAFALHENDTIVNVFENLTEGQFGPGTWKFVAVPHLFEDAGQLNAIIGMKLGTARHLLTLPNAPFCGLITIDQVEFIIEPDLPESLCSTLVASAGPDRFIDCMEHLFVNGTTNYDNAGLCVQKRWETIDGQQISSGQGMNINEHGTYVFFAGSYSGNCVVSDTVIITGNTDSLVANAGVDRYLACWDTIATLEAINPPAMGSGMQLIWKNESGQIISTSPIASVSDPGRYYLIVRDTITGCEVFDEVQVKEVTNEFAHIATTLASCNDANANATISLLPDITGNLTFAWSTGALNTSTVGGLSQGWYSVTVTDIDATCAYHQNFYVDEDDSCKVRISGRVLNDSGISQCMADTLDIGAESILLHLMPIDVYKYSNQDGEYEFVVPAGDYTIQYIEEEDYNLTCNSSGMLSVSLPTDGMVSTGNNFYVVPSLSDNLVLSAWYTAARPGFNQAYRIKIENKSEMYSDADLTFVHDSLLHDETLSGIADSYDAATRTATWHFDNLPPNSFAQVEFLLKVPPSTLIGTTIQGSAFVVPIANDTIPENNSLAWQQVITGSFDPNEKITLTGEDQWGGAIFSTDTTIHYVVNFQNTGTDTAFAVVIKDTIDANLDIATIRTGISSHDYNLEFEGENVLVFNFNEIMLPDSNINESASHGFVAYSIKTKAGLDFGAEIKNKAAIYFDYNQPIITNTVVHTLTDETSGSQQLIHKPVSLEIFPNPNDGQFRAYFNVVQVGACQFYVYDMMGRLEWVGPVFEIATKDIGMQLLNLNISSGVYCLKLNSPNGVISKRFVKK